LVKVCWKEIGMAGTRNLAWVAALSIMACMATSCFAQFGGAPGGRGGNTQFDQLKLDLGVTDDEWPALQEKVQKVVDAESANPVVTFAGRGVAAAGAVGGGRGGRAGGRRGGAAPVAAPTTPSAVQVAITDLTTTLADAKVSADVIKGKLEALRQARQKAAADLVAAQSELKAIVSPRQEAVMVVNGLLN
jgi:hypothetical protein